MNKFSTFWITVLSCVFSPDAAVLPLPDTGIGEFADSVVSISEVSVVGKKEREIIKPQSISGAELERLNSLSVADALRYFSGVQIKDYGGIGGIKTVNIRSMGTNHVGVFYNGMQLGNAQNGQVDLGRYSLDNVEEISLYNGQKFLFITDKRATFSNRQRISAHRAQFTSQQNVPALKAKNDITSPGNSAQEVSDW